MQIDIWIITHDQGRHWRWCRHCTQLTGGPWNECLGEGMKYNVGTFCTSACSSRPAVLGSLTVLSQVDPEKGVLLPSSTASPTASWEGYEMIYTNIQKSVKIRAGIHWGRREDQEIITQKKDPSHLQLEQKSRGMLDPETSSNSRQRPSAATRSWNN